MRNAECGMRNVSIAECGMRNAECIDCGLEGDVDKKEMKDRTKRFALRVIRLVESLPKGRTADVIGGQLLRCGTSVGANYRSACRARSRADFISKMGIVEEEADESLYWMEMLIEAELLLEKRLKDLMNEADEILAITISSIKTARKNK